MKSLALAALTAGCFFSFGARSAPTREVVRLGNLKLIQYGAVSYMKELGEECGLDIKERHFAKGIDVIPAFINDEVDVAAVGTVPAIAGRAAGVPIYAVAGLADGGARIIAAKDSGVRRLEDLKGKSVAVARGTLQELYLMAELAQHKITWSDKGGKDVKIQYLPFQDINAALATKQVDAACQTEPGATEALVKGFAVEVMKPYETPLGKPTRLFLMSEKIYKEKPAVAQKIVSCFLRSTRLFMTQPKVAEKYIRGEMFKETLSPTVYRRAQANSPFNDDVQIEKVQRVTDEMIRFGLVKPSHARPASEWVRPDLLEKARRTLPAKLESAKSSH